MNDSYAFQKRSKALELLAEGLLMLHVNPRPDSVALPAYLKSEISVQLNIAYGFRLPALEIGTEGIYAVLSFNRQNFPCHLPWEHIFALTAPEMGGAGYLWPHSLPTEIRAAFAHLDDSIDMVELIAPTTSEEGAPEGTQPGPATVATEPPEPTERAPAPVDEPPPPAQAPDIAEHTANAPQPTAPEDDSPESRRARFRLIKS